MTNGTLTVVEQGYALALDLAGGDPRRIVAVSDGFVVVNNPLDARQRKSASAAVRGDADTHTWPDHMPRRSR